jgi:hypothetical protein
MRATFPLGGFQITGESNCSKYRSSGIFFTLPILEKVSAKTLANATLFHSFSGIARLNF